MELEQLDEKLAFITENMKILKSQYGQGCQCFSFLTDVRGKYWAGSHPMSFRTQGWSLWQSHAWWWTSVMGAPIG